MNPADKGVPKPRKRLRHDAIPTTFEFPNTPKSTGERRVLKRVALPERDVKEKKSRKGNNILCVCVMNFDVDCRITHVYILKCIMLTLC